MADAGPLRGDEARRDRRSIRLARYDYGRPGAYFVTVVVAGREWVFGEVEGGVMRLNDAGKIVHAVWDGLPRHYPHVTLDAFVVMPNHVHGILQLDSAAGHLIVLDQPSNAPPHPSAIPSPMVGAGLRPALPPANQDPPPPHPTSAPRHALPEIVRAFKSFTSRQINALRGTAGTPVWQRNYYEHVIRGEESLDRIRQYVADNPGRWELDRERGYGVGEGGSETRPYGDVGRGWAGGEVETAGGG